VSLVPPVLTAKLVSQGKQALLVPQALTARQALQAKLASKATLVLRATPVLVSKAKQA
jgi:hypothetical protein